MEPVVVAEDLRRRYGDVVALDGVSLSIPPGEVFGLVGPNGAGKTTLIRALTGTLSVEGDVRVFGRPPREVDPARLGLLPQAFDPPDRLTPREILTAFAGLYDDARDVESVLDDVGLSDSADAWYETLSGGQRRRTCVATALVNDPDLLVLDEPTTGIDPAGRRALWRLVEDLAAAGTTVLFSTHYMAEAHRLADRVGLLADGRLVAVDDPDALVADHGGESRLVVEVADDAPDARSLSLGYETEFEDGVLTVREVPPRDIGDVVDALEATGVEYDAFTWREPDLEDVYLSLTGSSGATGDERPAARREVGQ